MNRKLVISLLLIVVFVLGVFYFFEKGRESNSGLTSGQVENVVDNNDLEDGSLAEELETEDVVEVSSGQDPLCMDEPRVDEIGSEVYPIAEKYAHLPFLGQVFTAYQCGDFRLEQLPGVNGGEYNMGVTLWLNESPGKDLLDIFDELGFFCVEDIAGEDCKYWRFEDSMEINYLIKLESYSEKFKSDDCFSCG